MPMAARATSVTATVTDAASQAWFNGTWSATLVTKPGFYPPSTGYVIGSTQLPVPNAHGVSGTMNGSGAFSVTLTDVTTIAPAGATWRIQVCPLASSGCFVAQVDVTGVSEDISAQLAPPAATVNLSLPAAYYLAYSDSEIINGNLGQTYMDLTLSKFKVCTSVPCGWVALGTVSGSGAANEVAIWSSPTAIGGSSAFTQDPTTKFVTITVPHDDDSELLGNLNLQNSSAPASSYLALTPADNGNLTIIGYSATGLAQMIFFTDGSITIDSANAATPQFIIDSADANITLGIGTYLKFLGSSGSAAIGVASAAGTPCTLLLPTVSPSAGQFLQSAAPSGGTCQGSWATPTNPLSGMAATQVAIAGSANTITSSKPLQGTDTNILTSGTVSGTGNTLCTDAQGGATTTGCASTGFPSVVYNTASAATTGNVGTTLMVTVGASNATYRISYYLELTVVGAGCAGGTGAAANVITNLIFQDPVAAGTITSSEQFGLTAAGDNGTVGAAFQYNPLVNFMPSFPFRAKAGTNIQYSTTYTTSTGCSPKPTYVLYPVLEQLTAN